MSKLKSKRGFTLAEMLLVVAIIIILSGVAFIAVTRYMRSLGQVERDGIAKEIFVAAQNHLTIAYGESYLGLTDDDDVNFGYSESDSENKIRYFVVNGISSNDNTVLSQMLPFGSIDETVRNGGSYIIRYQKDTGLVLDVFYCTQSGSPNQYNHTLSGDDYGEVITKTGDEKKDDRKNWNGAILGWYGGAKAAELSKLDKPIEAPEIEVINEEKLYVKIVNNPNGDGVFMRLLIKGLTSKTEHYLDVKSDEIVLDDITTKGGHFAIRVFNDDEGATSNGFIPGENISVQVVAYAKVLANIAYSNKVITNSLFEEIGVSSTEEEPGTVPGTDSDKPFNTAYIKNIRHLENLDKHVSKFRVEANGKDSECESFAITAAKQTSDFGWDKFLEKTSATDVWYTSATDSTNYTSSQGSFYPVSPDYDLTYDGQGHSISKIETGISKIETEIFDNAGLFGKTSSVGEIKDLELIDFSVKGTNSAGGLAGELGECSVINVLLRSSEGAPECSVEAASGNAGGLIGKIGSKSVRFSAANALVKAGNAAGGLIGDSGADIYGCYSAGFVVDAKDAKERDIVVYSDEDYNVIGKTAGGLVGNANNASITNSYSTCSVSGTDVAGGFAGSAGGNISGCYATGLMDDKGKSFAFLGSGSATLTGNYYYSIINQVEAPEEDENGSESDFELKEAWIPMLPAEGYKLNSTGMNSIQPLDLTADTYNTFTGSYEENWKKAIPYNMMLVKFFGGKYPLKTIEQLYGGSVPSGYDSWDKLLVHIHYGDWPSPAVFFINH